MRSDADIERHVTEELKWDPDLDATDISVKVDHEVIILTGFAMSFTDKYEAEIAAKRVVGIVAVANDIKIRLPEIDQRPDPDIARDAVAAIKSQLPVSAENIMVIVKNGWVTLEGTAEWQYQCTSGEAAVRRVRGVRGIINSIVVRPQAEAQEIKQKIEEALRRNAAIDASRITARRDGSEVILKGTVRSWAEREDAERALGRPPA